MDNISQRIVHASAEISPDTLQSTQGQNLQNSTSISGGVFENPQPMEKPHPPEFFSIDAIRARNARHQETMDVLRNRLANANYDSEELPPVMPREVVIGNIFQCSMETLHRFIIGGAVSGCISLASLIVGCIFGPIYALITALFLSIVATITALNSHTN